MPGNLSSTGSKPSDDKCQARLFLSHVEVRTFTLSLIDEFHCLYFNAARAAARRAIGTLKGEQLT